MGFTNSGEPLARRLSGHMEVAMQESIRMNTISDRLASVGLRILLVSAVCSIALLAISITPNTRAIAVSSSLVLVGVGFAICAVSLVMDFFSESDPSQ